MLQKLHRVAQFCFLTLALPLASVQGQSASKYEVRGLSLGLAADQVLAAAQAHGMAVAQNSAGRPGPFQVIIFKDKSVKQQGVGGDSNSGSGLTLTVRVNAATKKTVWIEAGQVGPGDLLQAAKGKWGEGRPSLTYPHSPADSCMGYGSTNKRLGMNRYVWGDCRAPHVEFYSKDSNTYSGIDTLLIIDPEGMKISTAGAPVPSL